MILIAALAATLQGAPASNPTAPVNAPTAGAAAAADPVICRRIADTGSRVGGARECLTKSQWAERQRVDAQNLRDSQTRGFQFQSPDSQGRPR